MRHTKTKNTTYNNENKVLKHDNNHIKEVYSLIGIENEDNNTCLIYYNVKRFHL